MKSDSISQYAESLMLAAMRKCANPADAEDLVQETVLAALAFLRKGGEIEFPKTWLSKTLEHKYYDMLRRKHDKPSVSHDQHLADIAYEEAGFINVLDSEDREAVRRELGHISKLYRTIMVRYYIHGESIDRIAGSLGIPTGTVKSRLDAGRKHLKEGLRSMVNYSQVSYAPMVLHVSNSGRSGMNDEPGSVVAGDRIAQNLLILAYDEPKTEVDLAREIGIPLPYIEPIVDRLVNNELMKRCRDNKVYTDFIIYKPEDNWRFLDAQKTFASDNFDSFWTPIGDALEGIRRLECCGTMNYRQKSKLEFYTVLAILDRTFSRAGSMVIDQFYSDFPDRPNGGKWIAMGYMYPDGYKVHEAPSWKYVYAGQRDTRLDSFLGTNMVELREFDTYIDGFDRYRDLEFPMSGDDLLKLLYVIYGNIDITETGLNPMMLENVPHFVERGILTNRDGKATVDIPVATADDFRLLNGIVQKTVETISSNIRDPFASHLRDAKLEIPKHLKSVPKQKQYGCSYLEIPMAVVYEAIKRKLFLREQDFVRQPVILVIDK